MSIESRSRQYGKVFEHWQIKEFLGSGSGGKTAVFRLVRTDSGWGVSALKIVNLIEERGDYSALTDFQKQDYIAAREECSRNAEQEVRLMDELRGNTNIVDYLDHTFVDWSDENGFGRDLLIRMEFLSVLRNDLKSGKAFTEAEILKVGRDICKALVLCHRKNILHRDIKPENIFRNKDGSYKLGDFGVSRVLDACPGAVASTGIGTFEYWPAEQMTGQYDKRVDIYSLGLVMYELSNQNRLPFAASTYVTNREVSKRLSGSPLPRPEYASSALSAVILKACAFNPAERYQSAAEFLKAINTVQQKATNAPQTKSPKPTPTRVTVNNEDDYATALAKELGLPEDIFVDDVYRTAPASADKVRQNYLPKTKSSYETVPAEKKQTHYQSGRKTFYKRKRTSSLLTAVILFSAILTFGIGVMIAGIYRNQEAETANERRDEEIIIENTSLEQQTLSEGDQPTETFENADETQASEVTEPTIEDDEPVLTQTVFLRTSNKDKFNDLFYEYNEDGTLYRFANRESIDHVVNYYVYDDGTLIASLESASSQEDRIKVQNEINSRLNYPTESQVNYRILNVDENGRVVRLVITDQHLNIISSDSYSYNSMGKKIEDLQSNSNSQIGDRRISYEYDNNGKLIRSEAIATGANSINTRWEYSYNEYGNIEELKQTEFWGKSLDTSSSKTVTYSRYTYNDDGLCLRIDDYGEWGAKTGAFKEYTYDSYGNIVQQTYKFTDNTQTATFTYREMQVTSEQADRLRMIYENAIGFLPINIVNNTH